MAAGVQGNSGYCHTECNEYDYATGDMQRKSSSCENFVSCHLTNNPRQNQETRHTSLHSNKQDLLKHFSRTHFECPVEVQTHKPHPPEEVIMLTQEMEEEFLSKRKLVISGLPLDCVNDFNLSNLLDEFGCTAVSKVKDGSVRVLFPSASNARNSLVVINSTKFRCHSLSASYGHPDSLLFVGNLPYTYSCQDLINLFEPYGTILRCFITCSLESGLSKGYGFVEFANREEALFAKQQRATKVIGLRSLRVDFSDNGMQTCEDLHSRTLFVDRLPKGFIEDGTLKEFFSRYGRVNFCQVALAPHTGVSRGFAFVDMSSSKESEHAQLACNGGIFHGHEIRVSFGMPCRYGACILQNRNSGLYNTGKLVVPVMAPLSSVTYEVQENVPFSYPCLQLKPSAWEKEMWSHTPTFPLTECTNCQMPENQSSSVTCCAFRSSDSSALTSLALTGVPQSPPSTQSWRVSKSTSAPTILTSHSSTDSHFHETENHLNRHSFLRKRSSSESDPCEDNLECDTVYDKPYIGQHQQGIPYLHPLKRIRMDN